MPALRVCATPGCTTLTKRTRCPEHTPQAWASSTRRASTLSGWEQQRRAQRILDQDDTCHVCGLGGADQVDHVTPLAEGGRDDLDNLRPIHRKPCHERKTQAEAQRARRRQAP